MDNLFFSLSELAYLGEDTIVGRTVRIRKPDRCRIGSHSILDDFLYVSCSLRVGSYTHIGANSSIIGGDGVVEIGDYVNIAPGCQIVSASHDFSAGGLAGPTIPEEFRGGSITDRVVLHDHVLLGCQTVVLPGAELPEGMSTGAMTLVTRQEYRPWCLYAGIPARLVKERRRDSILSQARRLGGEDEQHHT